MHNFLVPISHYPEKSPFYRPIAYLVYLSDFLAVNKTKIEATASTVVNYG